MDLFVAEKTTHQSVTILVGVFETLEAAEGALGFSDWRTINAYQVNGSRYWEGHGPLGYWYCVHKVELGKSLSSDNSSSQG